MKIREIILAAIVFVMGLGVWGFAQVGEERRVQPPVTVMGDDVGFRIEAYKGDTVLGTLVVRVKGKWVDAKLGGGGLRGLTVQ
jgi:hypothetical protein